MNRAALASTAINIWSISKESGGSAPAREFAIGFTCRALHRNQSHQSDQVPVTITTPNCENAERYITPELKQFEDKVLGARENR
jgi:DNA mismatch repair ATPase MutS